MLVTQVYDSLRQKDNQETEKKTFDSLWSANVGESTQNNWELDGRDQMKISIIPNFHRGKN